MHTLLHGYLFKLSKNTMTTLHKHEGVKEIFLTFLFITMNLNDNHFLIFLFILIFINTLQRSLQSFILTFSTAKVNKEKQKENVTKRKSSFIVEFIPSGLYWK